MSPTAVHTTAPQLAVLGHYTVPDEARVLVGRRIEGVVYVYDYPEHGNGRPYFVERGFGSKAELAVLIADYRRQAERLGACPMSHKATERAFELAALTSDRAIAHAAPAGCSSTCRRRSARRT